jgi:MFS family permease
MVALVSLSLSLTVWRLDGVPLALAPVFGLLAVVTGLALRWHTRRVERPILNLGLFRERAFLPATLTVLLSNMTMYTVLLSLPVFLARREGWSSTSIGLLLAAMSAQMIVFSPVGGWLSDRYGRRLPALVGTSMIALGSIPFVAIDGSWPWSFFLIPLAVIGIGIGLSAAPVQTAAMESAPSGETGQAAGLFSTMRYLGSITGSGIMAAILTGAIPSVTEFRVLYVLLVIAAAGAVLASHRLPSLDRRPSPSGSAAPLQPEGSSAGS